MGQRCTSVSLNDANWSFCEVMKDIDSIIHEREIESRKMCN